MFGRYISTSAAIKAPRKPFSIAFKLPIPDGVDEYTIIKSPKDLKDHYQGYLFHHPTTNEAYNASAIVKRVDPSVVYIASTPSSRIYGKGISHSQISDCAFEECAICAVESYLKSNYNISRRPADNPKRENGWRFLTAERDVAEWDGIWVREDGHVYFLEVKHCMSAVSLNTPLF